MSPAAKLELIALLEEKLRRQKGRRFDAMYPDTGPLSRQHYAKHMEFFAKGADQPFGCFVGGNGVGKTEGVGAYEATCHLTGRYPDWWTGVRFVAPISAWAAGDTLETTRDIIQRKLVGPEGAYGTGVLPADCIDRERMRKRSNGGGLIDTMQVRHVSGEWSTLAFKSYDQKRESFQGVEQDFIWLDEEPPPDIFEECAMRFRTRERKRLILTFTPLSGISDVVCMFIPTLSASPNEAEYEASGRYHVMCGWQDVPHLSESEKAFLLANTMPQQREARTKGIPSIGAGKIFPVEEEAFAYDPGKFSIHPAWPRVFAMDPDRAGENGKTAAVWGAHDRENDTIWLTDEYYRGQAEPSVNAAAIKARGAWIPGLIDPASAGDKRQHGDKIKSLADIYRGEGLDLQPANNDVDAGLLEVWQRLSQGRLRVSTHMQHWFSEFRVYRRDDKGRIVKVRDHLMDATRYLCLSGPKRAKVKTPERRPNMVEQTFGLY